VPERHQNPDPQNLVQFGRGTYGARSAVVGGSALRRAADAIIDKAKSMAAAMLEADEGDIEFKDGNFTVAGTDTRPSHSLK
jgi:aerobic carbon-monoxide dehydrogenase large subunit